MRGPGHKVKGMSSVSNYSLYLSRDFFFLLIYYFIQWIFTSFFFVFFFLIVRHCFSYLSGTELRPWLWSWHSPLSSLIKVCGVACLGQKQNLCYWSGLKGRFFPPPFGKWSETMGGSLWASGLADKKVCFRVFPEHFPFVWPGHREP